MLGKACDVNLLLCPPQNRGQILDAYWCFSRSELLLEVGVIRETSRVLPFSGTQNPDG